MKTGQTIALIGVIGILSYMKWGDSFMAEGEEANGFSTIVERIKQRFTPSDLEEVTGERSGMTVDTIPLNYAPSVSQAGHFAFDKTTTYRIRGGNDLYIEDIFEGVGCLNDDAVVSTDFGLFFADNNNIYKHNDCNSKPK